MLNSGPFIQKIERLEDELEIARAQIERMQDGFGTKVDWPYWDFSLTFSEGRVVMALYKREKLTCDQVLMAIHAEDPEHGMSILPKNAHVHVSKARGKLKRFGVEIKSLGYGKGFYGYHMPAESKAKLKSLMDRQFLKRAAE